MKKSCVCIHRQTSPQVHRSYNVLRMWMWFSQLLWNQRANTDNDGEFPSTEFHSWCTAHAHIYAYTQKLTRKKRKQNIPISREIVSSQIYLNKTSKLKT